MTRFFLWCFTILWGSITVFAIFDLVPIWVGILSVIVYTFWIHLLSEEYKDED